MKLIIAVLAFALSNSLFRAHVWKPAVANSWGAPFYLPDLAGYFWALVISFVVLIAWWALTAWNEETDKLTMY